MIHQHQNFAYCRVSYPIFIRKYGRREGGVSPEGVAATSQTYTQNSAGLTSSASLMSFMISANVSGARRGEGSRRVFLLNNLGGAMGIWSIYA